MYKLKKLIESYNILSDMLQETCLYSKDNFQQLINAFQIWDCVVRNGATVNP